VATPMEYDTLREIFSSAGAALHRLKVTYGVAIEKYAKDKEKFNAIWINEVHKKDLEQIDYKTTALHLKAAAKPWMDLAVKLRQNSQKDTE